MMKLNNNTFFISDPHYGHKNLVRGVSSWENKRQCRNFDTIEEMNETLVKNINEKVPETGTIICLGDWSFGGIENIWNFRKQINCKDIHLVLGNHDHHIENNKKLPNRHYKDVDVGDWIIDGIKDGAVDEKEKDNLFPAEKDVHARDLFSSVQWQLHPTYKTHGHRYYFVLNHCAMRVWPSSHKGSIMLYGHSHGTLDEFTPNIANPTWIGDQYYIRNYRTMDVGLDTNDLYPYHIDEIVDMMRDREIGFEVDHHK